MEEYSQPPADDELTPENKKRFLPGNFLIAWLAKRHKSAETKPVESEEDEAETETAKKEKKWLPEKIAHWTRRLFRRNVGLEPVEIATAATAEKPEPAEKALQMEDNKDRPAEPTDIDLESRQDMAMEYELPPLPESDEDENEEGLLLVSDESINRFKQARKRQATEQERIYQEASAGEPQRVKLPDKLPAVDRDHVPKHEVKQPAMSAGEVLRSNRRYGKKFSQEMAKIKSEAVSIKNEQRQIKARQEVFQRQLLQKEADNTKIIKDRLPKPLQPPETQRLQEKLQSPKIRMEQKTPLAPKPEVAPGYRPRSMEQNDLKNFVVHEKQVKPEAVFQKVEMAAEHNVPIESLYERRHEIKGEDDNLKASQPVGQGYASSLAAMQNNLRRQVRQGYSKLPAVQTDQDTSAGTDLYRRAARSGFWTAIVLCILMFFALWLG